MNTQKTEELLQRNAELERELATKTRELQIEAALDRVRTRAMAMQHSDELKDLIALVSAELTELDFALNRCSIIIFNTETKGMTWWMAHPETPAEPIGLFVKYHEQPPFIALLRGWQNRQLRWQYLLEGEVKKTWDKFLFVETELSQLSSLVIANMRAVEKVYLSASYNNFGGLSIATLEPLSDEQFDVLLRFAKVFDLTYTRFNDLKQAEAQAREARIEAALERVRTVAMSMRKPDDLLIACEVVHKELYHLGFDELRNTMVNIYNDAEQALLNHDYSVDSGPQLNRVPYDSHSIVRNYVDEAKQRDDAFTQLVIEGAKLEDWKKFREVQGERTGPKLRAACALYYYHYSFKTGVMGISTFKPVNTEQLSILQRFRNVFNLSYQRYIDIAKAEAQAREARIEAALERVRARTMAMQQSEELPDAANLLFQQVQALGIPVVSCGYNIFEKADTVCTAWMSDRSGSIQPSFKIPLTESPTFIRFRESRQKGEQFYIEEISDEALAAHYTYMITLPFFKEIVEKFSRAGFALPTYQINHVVNFLHGNLIFITEQSVPEAWNIFKRFANVFEQTYTRFLDLQMAEAQAVRAEQDLIEIKAARKKAEDTLTALKATQQQLIQQEKMASLGELTAGIAHEIQNPLNFINNFSEISKELVEELKQEAESCNTVEVKALADDVMSNLEKVVHHGKRADNIVKSMLQHARASSGEKEPTDINKLADEYLMLSYQGQRAKDKALNASLHTNFDPTVEQISVVPQEIGRVLLNLFNNAFYALQRKKALLNGQYEPVVSLSTIKQGNHVLITVKDNGTGIPEKVLNKIYQPFFTTKPTGEGTGLGLSLSYDIITKGHGGNLSVHSTEGEGSEFVIELPVC